MKNKKGFTLSEVLIALGIVGILAAVTLPTLQANTSRKSIGPSVMKAFSLLKNANKLILTEKESMSLASVCAEYTDYLDCISQHTGMTKMDGYTHPCKYNSGSCGAVPGLSYYNTKDGMIFWFDNAGTSDSKGVRKFTLPASMKEDYSGDAYMILVDINGTAKPNEMGKDVFRFFVDDYGAVLPSGSTTWAEYVSVPGSVWTKTCKDDSKPTDMRHCSGSVVANGGKIMYKF